MCAMLNGHQWYRAMLRATYAAVKNTPKQRQLARQRVRRGFEKHRHVCDPATISQLESQMNNTIAFLDIAARQKGIAADIVRNLCDLEYYQNHYATRPPMYKKKMPPEIRELHNNADAEIQVLITMLNRELQLCL